jgi:hypothetical protein
VISKELHSAIEHWASCSTWHTNHPSDDERFYDLIGVFEAAGPDNFSPDDFMDVAGELLRKHHPALQSDFLDEHLSDKVLAAERILGYVAHRGRSAA